jgi:signal recognition particle receptor subunit beta
MWKEVLSRYDSSTNLEIFAAILVLIISFVILYRLTSTSRSGGPDVTLLLGPCGAGKTAMFFKWQSPKLKIKTVTSQSINRGFVLGKNEVIDYPGHPRLRGGLSTLIPRARRIVFVVDSASSDEEFKSAAELLYDIFVTKDLRPDTQMLIACNKSDLQGGHSCREVEKNLNIHIELLRRSRMQGELEGDNSIDQYLGVDDEAFDLRTHSPLKIEFASTSLKKLDDIEFFITS